jgi:hypothetical protein
LIDIIAHQLGQGDIMDIQHEPPSPDGECVMKTQFHTPRAAELFQEALQHEDKPYVLHVNEFADSVDPNTVLKDCHEVA